MNKVESITSKLRSLFRQMKTLDNEEYEKVVMNIELLKKHYFSSKFQRRDADLLEGKFRDLIN